jgi:Fic family protein
MMKPYIPETLPIKDLNHKRLIQLVGRANAELARYDGLLQAVVNPEVLLFPLSTQEAVLSSRIEGTQATLDEVLRRDSGMPAFDEKTEKDIQEIVNYRSVLIEAEKQLKNRPITLFLIRQMHKELMASVRGRDKESGRFRSTRNYIGKPGTPIEKATFVSPEPHILQAHLESLEKYLQTDDLDTLIQCAVMHAQFELIHPFMDGNGRIGRLLVPLFLYQKKRLSRPMFYLSEYLEENRGTYYSKLEMISKSKDWNGWVEFFLCAVSEQAIRNSTKVKAVLDLYKELKNRLYMISRSKNAMPILDALFYKPIFIPADLVKRSNTPKQTLMPILKKLQTAGILKVIREAKGRTPAVLSFSELLNITEGKKVL